jgi:hypothetical protein
VAPTRVLATETKSPTRGTTEPGRASLLEPALIQLFIPNLQQEKPRSAANQGKRKIFAKCRRDAPFWGRLSN